MFQKGTCFKMYLCFTFKIAFILADAGYDVWLGNARGNTYSKRHISFRHEDSEFWDFSWHEMAYFDVPAEIDYLYKIRGMILNISNIKFMINIEFDINFLCSHGESNIEQRITTQLQSDLRRTLNGIDNGICHVIATTRV